MKCLLSLAFAAVGCSTMQAGDAPGGETAAEVAAAAGKIAIVLHGGAGGLEKGTLRAEQEEGIRAGMKRALQAGYALLEAGGTSLDAVQAAIVVLEDDPHFNAGKGAVKTGEGKHELDASIMNGQTLKAGAVGGVTSVRNPIKAARLVMEKTWHVMLAGPGADAFARLHDLAPVEQDYFDARHPISGEGYDAQVAARGDGTHFGTVGAVALDREGNLAAGTSTGGLSGKKFGRIGDSPIIGAGTYADNATCGVSGTGQGEFFIRRALAFDISARMKYAGQPLAKAAEQAIAMLTADGGLGGVIALDQTGAIATSFNTSSMVRGYIDVEGKLTIAIFPD